jgi:hypothetical protein
VDSPSAQKAREQLAKLLAAGNHRALRKQALGMLQQPDKALVEVAREFLKKTSPDPIAYVLLPLVLLLIAALSIGAILAPHAH